VEVTDNYKLTSLQGSTALSITSFSIVRFSMAPSTVG